MNAQKEKMPFVERAVRSFSLHIVGRESATSFARQKLLEGKTLLWGGEFGKAAIKFDEALLEDKGLSREAARSLFRHGRLLLWVGKVRMADSCFWKAAAVDFGWSQKNIAHAYQNAAIRLARKNGGGFEGRLEQIRAHAENAVRYGADKGAIANKLAKAVEKSIYGAFVFAKGISAEKLPFLERLLELAEEMHPPVSGKADEMRGVIRMALEKSGSNYQDVPAADGIT